MNNNNKSCLGCLGIIVLVIFGVVLLGTPDAPAPTRQWETIDGVQMGTRLVLDIDDNSIQRDPDGTSASVEIRLPGDSIQRVTYYCANPSAGSTGSVIWQGQPVALQPGITSYVVMERICFGPLPDANSN